MSFRQHPSIGLRERPYEAFDRLDHDSPLRFGLQDAERAELQLRLRRNPKDGSRRAVVRPGGVCSAQRVPCAST
jgi:hypothetical protein